MITAVLLAAFTLHVGDSVFINKWHICEPDQARKVAVVEQTKDPIVLRVYDIESEQLESVNRFAKFSPKEFQMIGIQEYFNEDEELESRTEYNKDGERIRFEALYPNGQVSLCRVYTDKDNYTLTQYYENGKMRRTEQVHMENGERKATGHCYAQDGTETEYVPYETTASFIGGMDGLKKFLAKNLQYPPSYTIQHAHGTAVIGMVVDENGQVSNRRMLQSAGYADMDKEAMRIANLITKMEPATKDGEPISSKFAIPIAFSLK
ncbi:MAG: TonB family protein [Paludibacteraceae bacterium]|nr:TonB family protein [Paludibacteraceae bacterium]